MPTPMNELPILIDHAGLYLTRGGKQVLISIINDHSDNLEVTRFNCKGYLLIPRKGKADRKVWGIWHQSGWSTGFPDQEDYIVKEVGT